MTIIIPFHGEINKTLGNKHDAQGSKVNKYRSQDVNLGDWSSEAEPFTTPHCAFLGRPGSSGLCFKFRRTSLPTSMVPVSPFP